MKEKLNRTKRLNKLKEQGFQTGDKILRETSSNMDKQGTHTRISDSIILYTHHQSENKFDYTVGYENVDTGIVGLTN